MRKTFADLKAPVLAGVVRETTTRGAIAQIKNCLYDGADMIDLHMSTLEDSSVESLKKIERPFTLPIRDWEPLAKGIKPHQRQYRVAVALRRIIKKRCTA